MRESLVDLAANKTNEHVFIIHCVLLGRMRIEVPGYTIPQEHCRFPIVDCQLNSSQRHCRQLAIGNRKSAMSLVAVEGIEPTSLDYRSSALAVELHRDG
jgi:hypothetical protein